MSHRASDAITIPPYRDYAGHLVLAQGGNGSLSVNARFSESVPRENQAVGKWIVFAPPRQEISSDLFAVG